ncbi:MAG: hypothetical protein WD801_02105 [Gemmatimonadaceae bacterium]
MIRFATLRSLAFLAVLLVPVGVVRSQDPAPASDAPLSVFLDCQTHGCDFDYLRTEIALVNWVRDRQEADVHLLVTSQSTGAGGTEFTIAFIGLRRFAGMVDTLRQAVPPASTADAVRRALADAFRLGLVRYLARTPAAGRLTIDMSKPAGESQQSRPQNDRWNAWVFRIGANAFAQGEATSTFTNLRGNLSANRITEQWKTQLSGYQSYDDSKFDLDDTTKIVVIQRSHGASALQVKSLGARWSAGMRADLNSSTYDNFKRVVGLFPAVEYNLFPYSESTRRQLRLEYNIGYSSFAYHDTTINNKVSEGMPMHRLRLAAAARQPWGSVDVEVQGIGYLNDREMYRLGSYSELSLSLFKGFNFNLFGSYTVIRDQFALAKKDFTPEEILTRQFQRATHYRFFGGAGLSYTFGSIYNNVVNPRFNGGF